MIFLPDVNLWLALAFQSHVHHSVAKAWFESRSGGECVLCRMTQQGLLRLATNPRAFGPEAMSLAGVWRFYDDLLADPRVEFITEPQGVESVWRSYTERGVFTAKVWNDAYLAAFANVGNLRIATFDRDFRQFANLQCDVLC